MIKLTVGRKFSTTTSTVKEAINNFFKFLDEYVCDGYRFSDLPKITLKVNKETYRVSTNGRIWDKDNNEVKF